MPYFLRMKKEKIVRAAPQRLFNQITRQMKAFHSKPDEKLLLRAFELSIRAHGNQKRASGEPYWTHPANVALILAKWGADSSTIAASFLHDVLEDTPLTQKELKREFGPSITHLVEGVTKLDQVAKMGKKFTDIANIQKIMLAASKDWRVMTIKLADRLHNVRTLSYLPVRTQKRVATDALLLYVPIARKLGLHSLVDELTDTAFYFIDKKAYLATERTIQKSIQHKRAAMQSVIRSLKKKLPKARFFMYRKNIYHVYTKLNKTQKDIDSLSDVQVLCIETKTAPECYEALGQVHLLYPPIPKKIKDYIAIPQPNMYAGLHTTVIGPKGRPLKVYIATRKMFDLNNRGVMAIDNEVLRFLPQIRNRIEKIDQLFNLPTNFEEANEFMSALELDFLPKTISVFTTEGESFELPIGATPLDFAFYYLDGHGERLWKAKVNGQFVNLNHPLESGDIIEFLLSKEKQFNERWIKMANTQLAKKRIQALAHPSSQPRNIDVVVFAKDRLGILSILTEAFSMARIKLLATTSISYRGETVSHFNLGDVSMKKLAGALEEIRKIAGVIKLKAVDLNEPDA